mmetsp:Transcript_8984/g.25881  ORF Transcript_8984/g.25881 Transcript_8984/m.25881 type:complete len:221 (-) Transcript_8984:706-1368(-)
MGRQSALHLPDLVVRSSGDGQGLDGSRAADGRDLRPSRQEHPIHQPRQHCRVGPDSHAHTHQEDRPDNDVWRTEVVFSGVQRRLQQEDREPGVRAGVCGVPRAADPLDDQPGPVGHEGQGDLPTESRGLLRALLIYPSVCVCVCVCDRRVSLLSPTAALFCLGSLLGAKGRCWRDWQERTMAHVLFFPDRMAWHAVPSAFFVCFMRYRTARVWLPLLFFW